jgi:hypothetical protein
MVIGKKAMYKNLKSSVFLLPVVLLIFLFSCTTFPEHPAADRLVAYTVKKDETLLSRYAPVFVIENHKERYNLIGTPSAEITQEMKEKIYVDPEKATIYVQKRMFKTFRSNYTNLVYRVHFEKIPGGLVPFYLGKGKNTGLIVIITLSSRNEPILYTVTWPLFRHHICLRADFLMAGKEHGSLYSLKISPVSWTTKDHPPTGTER